MVSPARQSSDGQSYYFFLRGALDPATGNLPWPAQFSKTRAGTDGVSGLAALPADSCGIRQARWADNGRGAVIVQMNFNQPDGAGQMI